MIRRFTPLRGFALLELLILLGMLGLILLAAGRLFESTIRLGHATGEAANAAAGMEALSSALRADGWIANELRVSQDTFATLVQPGDGAMTRAITWTIKPGSITRTDGTDVRQWPIVEGATFAIEGPSLILKLPPTKTFAGGEVRVTSEIQLLSKALR
ncbi:MAG: hypothetical protein ABIP55_11635 [Tepidisphaeraceae bacterium]